MTAPERKCRGVKTVVLDIDGVLVLETSVAGSSEEVLVLHDGLESRLEQLGAEVFFLTHRSRPEAEAILGAAGLGRRWLDRCLCANDILSSAVLSGQWLRLASHGMRKSLALPRLRSRFGVSPSRCLFVDDRLDNVLDMCRGGIGVGAVAPSGVDAVGSVTTFDFDEVAEIVRTHQPAVEEGAAVLHLRPHEIRIESQHRTGLVTRHTARNGFNIARRSAAIIRRGFVAVRDRTSPRKR